MAVYTKKWNGSAWVTAPIKKWNGSAWVDAYTYKWDGSKWVQIYPETITSAIYTLSSGGGYRSWRTGSSGNGYEAAGSDVAAKQGPYGSYTPAYGYLDMDSNKIPGTKNITSISSLLLNANRSNAGSYNAAKTIFFYRSANKPEDIPTLLGSAFTATAPGVGKDIMYYDQPVARTTDTLNWANQVNSGRYLWIYTNDANHYLSMKNVSMEFTYQYLVATALFEDDGAAVAYNMTRSQYENEYGEKVYHSMPIYQDEVDMTLAEIIQRREDGIVEDIDPTNTIITTEIAPWFRERKVFEENGELKVKIEAMHLTMDTDVQYSLDNVSWDIMYGEGDGEYVKATLPNDFNKYKDNVYVRIYNRKKDMVLLEDVITPVIYIP